MLQHLLHGPASRAALLQLGSDQVVLLELGTKQLVSLQFAGVTEGVQGVIKTG